MVFKALAWMFLFANAAVVSPAFAQISGAGDASPRLWPFAIRFLLFFLSAGFFIFLGWMIFSKSLDKAQSRQPVNLFNAIRWANVFIVAFIAIMAIALLADVPTRLVGNAPPTTLDTYIEIIKGKIRWLVLTVIFLVVVVLSGLRSSTTTRS